MKAPFFHCSSPSLRRLVGGAAKALLLFAFAKSGLADPLDYWTWRNPKPQGDELVAAAYGKGTFVAVSLGKSGTIIQSTNGVTWSLSFSGVQRAIYGVAYGNDQFVAVGEEGTIITSRDGLTWGSADSGTSHHLFGVTCGAGQFVAVGWGGTVLVSTNGITWVVRAPATEQTLLDIGYGNQEFVAIGTSGTIITSSDGVTWNSRNSLTTKDLVGIAYGGGQFIAGDRMKGLVSSTNGVEWRSYDVASQEWLGLNRITYADDRFVAVGNYGLVINSTNGLDWSLSDSGTGCSLRGITWGNGLYVGVGDAGTISTSSDGSHWKVRSSGIYAGLNAISYSRGAFVAVGEGGAILRSCDRTNWTAPLSGTTNYLSGVACGAGRFVVVGWNRTILASDDGNAWVARSPPPQWPIEIHFSLGAVAYGADRFVAVGSDSIENVALWSTNGLDWSYGEISGMGSAEGLAYGSGRFVAICYREWYGSFSHTSTDGVRWIQHDPVTSDQIYGIVYGKGIFVGVGETGLVMTSSDGITWARQTSGIANDVNLTGVAFGNDEFVAVSTGPLFASPDGTNWIAHASPAGQLQALTYVGNHFIAVGIKGRILESDPVRIPLQPRLEGLGYGDRDSFQFELNGSSNQLYLVQVSTDLTQWTPMVDVVPTNGLARLEDPSARTSARRLYKAIVP